MAKRTALYDTHVKLGGRIVDFAGWELPVQYEKGIIKEHTAVRTAAGVFDVSHMGEIYLDGKGAFASVQRIATNDITGMADGGIRYSMMCYESGTIVDDILIYRRAEDSYLIVVNAGNRDKDAAWISSHLAKDTKFADRSDEISEIAVQGPFSEAVLIKLADKPLPAKYYTFTENYTIAGAKAMISRTGYTGEKGFEVYIDNAAAPAVYEAIITAGKEFGIEPCGLGARDTLRFEAAMPLYGHELSDKIYATETGLDSFIKFTKDFIGSEALKSYKPEYRRTGAKITDRGIAREGCEVFDSEGKKIGMVTSGNFSPTLNEAFVMLRIEKSYDKPKVIVDVRGRKLSAEIVPLPFYKRAK